MDYLGEFPFYTAEDRWFRYLRDQMLGPDLYEKSMIELMQEFKYDQLEGMKELWMSEHQLGEIASAGHSLGLHSFSHPTQISKLDYASQKIEYEKNLVHLEKILGKDEITSMSHPCGDYNQDTLNILRDLKIKVGFRSNIVNRKKSDLEIPREDHANIFKLMRNEDYSLF